MSEMIHWTENFGGVSDGTPHYNRMVRRVAGRDLSGPSTLWHGTNCAETFLGRFWAVRSNDNKILYLDWLDNGRWHGFEGMARDTNITFWQRLRAVGNTLWIFGYRPAVPVPLDAPNHTNGKPPLDPVTGKPLSTDPQAPQDGAQSSSDHPLCAIADGQTLRDADFPFFVRRATPSGDAGNESLFVAARADGEGIGPANRVVQIITENGGRTHICSLWNEAAHAFVLTRADFTSVGGDPAKLPAFFKWVPLSNTNGGGKWKTTSTAPQTGAYLQTQIDTDLIRFVAYPDGTLPYDKSQWAYLCFDILSDGGVDSDGPLIEPTCDDAKCAIERMPPGTRFRVLTRPVSPFGPPLTSLQITDPSQGARLSTSRDASQSLWMRVDSDAPAHDLSTYTQFVPYNRLTLPKNPARHHVEVVVLIPPSLQPIHQDELPILQRRS